MPLPSFKVVEAPLVVLRTGIYRGQRIAVLALMPVFRDRTVGVHELLSIELSLGEVRLLSDPSQIDHTSSRFVDSPVVAPNDAAKKKSVRIEVSEGGIYEIRGTDLIEAGLDIQTFSSNQIQIAYRGTQIPIEIREDEEGQFSESSRIRFSAPELRSRWSLTETLWLSIEEDPGLRLTLATPLTKTLTPRETAMEVHEWRPEALYDSKLAGPDGNHWYALQLRTSPFQPAAAFTLPVTSALIANGDPLNVTLSGTAYATRQHRVVVDGIEDGIVRSQQTMKWTGDGLFLESVSVPTRTTEIVFRLMPGETADVLQVDSVRWEVPITPSFSGGPARFRLPAGDWSIILDELPIRYSLYDVSSALRPRLLARNAEGGAGNTFVLESTGESEQEYILVSEDLAGDFHTLFLPSLRAPGNVLGASDTAQKSAVVRRPVLSPNEPVVIGEPAESGVLYIAPNRFVDELEPLIAHRTVNGIAAAAIAVEDIYDIWGYGSVSPDAIRNFIRHSVATWADPPETVVLVGDGTWDPLDRLGFGNETLIPPYLAQVDFWLGETACDTCYVQLDGESPLDDILPDLYVGRLPVKSEDELQSLISKIIGYEEGAPEGVWRSRIAYVTDNYREKNGKIDGAGDFAHSAEESIAILPKTLSFARLYYDPSPSHTDAFWREPDPEVAYARTRKLLDESAAFINYLGHAHHWQWAFTSASADPPYLLGLYDVDQIENSGRLPVILELTCLTGAFHQPATSGTTLDERWILDADGGAIAVWAPTGFGVAYGHDPLQRGFYRALIDQPEASVGELAQAGYLELFTNGTCCQENIRTYTILGDPSVKPQIHIPEFEPALYIPILQH